MRTALDLALVSPLLAPRHLDLARAAAERIGRELAPRAAPADDGAARLEARQILSWLGATGWLGWAVPEAGGGLPGAPDLTACCLLRDALAGASPLADAVFALQCLGSMPITLAGSEEQRRLYLPGVVAGRLMAAFAMTEPEAGSDVSAISTLAAPDGAGYRLSGRKIFISNAGLADYYVVFASTDPSAGRRGLSCFMVDAELPGVRFVRPQVLSAPHPLGEMAFEEVRLPPSARLGGEGEGFRLGMATLDRLRATVAAAACGMAGRALLEALAHARGRRQFGRPLAELQLVQDKLAQMATELAAARLLTYRAAREADAGGAAVTLQSAMAKSYATEAAQRVVDQAVQILGGAGVLAESVVDRLYRSVRALRIYEGTTEIQRLVVARRLLRGSGGEG